MSLVSSPPAEITTDGPESPYCGSISVNAGYYGTVVDGRIGWAMEFVPTVAVAQRIIRNQEAIDRIVLEHADGTPTKMSWLFTERPARSRVTVTFDGDQMTVADYDWNRWSVTVPAVA